jgi:4a-hydroxytetrahydrobiopterin dehydratase
MSVLAEKECLACKGDVPPLKGEALAKLARELGGHWQIVQDRQLA